MVKINSFGPSPRVTVTSLPVIPSATGGGGGLTPEQPCAHFTVTTLIDASERNAVPPPFSWTELGLVGKLQSDFSYLELAPGTTMPSPGDDLRLRSVGGQVAVEVNGVTVCGPVDLPPELVGSTLHGVQMDVADDLDENEGIGLGVDIEVDATPLTVRSAPLTPAIGSPVETASSTTLNVPYPSGITAGQSLYCVMATKNGGTFSAAGWTLVTGSNYGVVAGIQVGVLTKTAVGSESGSLTVTKSAAGIMAGVMFRATGDRVPVLGGQANGSASTSIPCPAITMFGPMRTLVWIAATNIDTIITPPDDYFPLSAGLSANQDLRLAVAVVVADSHPDMPPPPFNAYSSGHFPAQVGAAASSAQSAAGHLILSPAFV